MVKKGFSLAEMMVVMLILSIVLAAATPIITHRVIASSNSSSDNNDSSLPSGVIVIWKGSVATIPEGWHLCDGTNGTPDLRDRFIVGAGNSYLVGAVGGEASHTLNINEIPSHNHEEGGWNVWDMASPKFGIVSSTSLWNPAARYTNTSTTGYTYSTSWVGGGYPHENRPPYYALAYIMRL